MQDTEKIAQRVRESGEITEFQRKVYLELLKVPAGETISYGELAQRIGCRSAQAVGQALKRNPFAPDVPCHRVVGAKYGRGGRSDGDSLDGLGGYFGHRTGPELERKLALLKQERAFGCDKCNLSLPNYTKNA